MADTDPVAILSTTHARLGAHTVRFIRTLCAPPTTEALAQERHLLHLVGRYPADRFEAACRRALFYSRTPTVETVRHILDNGLDRLSLDSSTDVDGQLFLDFCCDSVSRLPREIPLK